MSTVMSRVADPDRYRGGCLQLRAYCVEVSQEQKGGQTAVLIRQLADWGMAAKQMHEVIRLPLDGLEEQVSLPACLSVCLSVCLSACLSVCVSVFFTGASVETFSILCLFE